MELSISRKIIAVVLLAAGASRAAGGQRKATNAACNFAHATPKEVGVDPASLDSLVAAARAAHSDALVVVKDGRVVREWYSDSGNRPIDLKSATKSVVGFLVARLVEQRRIKSLDSPITDFYPEWKQGRKRQITVRELLNHTSGLQNEVNSGLEVDYTPDVLKLALSAELSNAPGTMISYNNKAVALLAGIVQRASGMSLERYADRELFAPLCIATPAWERDSVGTAYAHTGLSLDAISAAKIGQVMIDSGAWHGRRVLARAWVDSLMAQSQPFATQIGLLWWRLAAWTNYTIDSALVASWTRDSVGGPFATRVQPLVGRSFTADAFNAALDSLFGPNRGRAAWQQATVARGLIGRRALSGPLRAAYASGYLGQYIVVIPASRVVAVRLVRARAGHTENDDFLDFPEMVARLFR